MDIANILKGLLGGNVKKNTKPGNIASGIGCGFVLILAALAMTYYSVSGVKEESGIVDTLSPQAATEVAADERGLVELYGQLDADELLDVAVDLCYDRFCDLPGDAQTFEDLLYYSVRYERKEVVRKVTESEKTEGSSAVKETVEYEEKWVEKESESKWSGLKMAGVDINAETAKTIIDFDSMEVTDVYLPGLGDVETYNQPTTDEVGQVRATVSYLKADDREYTVVGELRSGEIRGGDVFILSDLSHDQLVSSLVQSESTMKTVMRIMAWLMLTFGFTSLLAPILALTDFIPLVCNAARTVAGIVSALIAGVIVLSTVFLLEYWWVCLLSTLVLFVVAGAGFYMWYKNKQEGSAKTKA